LKEKFKHLNESLLEKRDDKLKRKFLARWINSYIRRISARKNNLQAKHFYYFKKIRKAFESLYEYKRKNRKVNKL